MLRPCKQCKVWHDDNVPCRPKEAVSNSPSVDGYKAHQKPETDEQKEILGKMTSLACGDVPEGYYENGKKLWEAFLLGVSYSEKAL